MHARPRRLTSNTRYDEPFTRYGAILRDPQDHYVKRMLILTSHLPRRWACSRATASRRRRYPPRSGDHSTKRLDGCSAAPRYWRATTRWSRSSASTGARRAADADEIFDQHRRTLADRTSVVRALYDRFSDRNPGHDRPYGAYDLAHHAVGRRRGLGTRVRPHLTARRLHRTSPSPADRRRRGARPRSPTSTLATTSASSTALAAAGASSSRTARLATDHGHVDRRHRHRSRPPTPARSPARARPASCTPVEAAAFGAHMLFEMARMNAEDGLVMQIHPGVLRDHISKCQRVFGEDNGLDIPISIRSGAH